MPRHARIVSKSGYYHVTMRGNARGVIFESAQNRDKFLSLMEECCTRWKLRLFAWCLMDNHVHMVVDVGDADLSEVLHWLATSYAVYFNRFEERVGHLFQCPFGSKPIEYENQLVNTVKYVHYNPERAHICSADAYPWSSYAEYRGKPKLVDPEPVFEAAGGRGQFFAEPMNVDYVVRLPGPNDLRTADEIRIMLNEEIGDHAISKLQNAPKHERNRWIVMLKSRGLHNGQIARLCAVSERTVRRALVAECDRISALQSNDRRVVGRRAASGD